MKAFQVFLASALGALIGTLVALQLSPMFWWVGLLVGGFTGYMTYNLPQVVQAIPKAWNSAISWRPRLSKERFKNSGTIWIFVLSVVWSSLLGVCLIVGGIIFALEAGVRATPIGELLLNMVVAAGGLSFLIASCMAFLELCGVEFEKWDAEERKSYMKTTATCNPISIYVWYVPKYTIIVLIWAVLHVHLVFLEIGKFTVTLFRFIHSDLRLLCGVNAAIGAWVGFHFGNALVGALVGGALGLLGYEIISKRVLKLATSS